ncbi:MAG: hypothetical protein AAF389_10150 [Gemmatimonadota bacterium]
MKRTCGRRHRCAGLALCVLALSVTPARASAQIEVSAGLLVAPDAGMDGTPVGPALAARTRIPGFGALSVEAGWARTDFTAVGRDFHNDHFVAHLSHEWRLIRGPTVVGVRFGVGAYGEFQTVESDPPTGGGDNWFETVVPEIVLARAIAPNRRIVISVSDAILGPVNAVFDPSEYSVEHRIRLLVGLEF